MPTSTFDRIFLIAALVATLLFCVHSAYAERVKDLADVEGVRSNHLIGYGLVVGLDGTGDQTTQAPFTIQSLESMLRQLGVTIPAGSNPQLKNVAAVAVHAELRPFAKVGQTIDVTVSSIGNAGSLRGGTLLMTPLKGADGQVYVLAQGNIVVGGLGISGKDGSRVSVNIPSVGRIPNGGSVEREVPNDFATGGDLLLNLHTPDFTTAARTAEAINASLKAPVARAVDAVTVAVKAPAEPNDRVEFLASLESIEVNPGDAPARVIVNSRTGTVVISNRVQVTPAAVAHGHLSVTVTERPRVSQPGAFSQGTTQVVPTSSIEINESTAHAFVFDAGIDLEDIVRAINQVGAAPGDLVAILEALREAGALRAELIVI
ncbi:MAG: flagellar basal body P-ring protein FlgI [Nevskia sp.]|nr:flagellar basal body P-ring protein FlgI [Nevskia sp.]